MLRAVLTVSFFALLLGAAGDAQAQMIHGHVLQLGTRIPLKDVAVSLRDSDGRTMTSAVTDTAGAFRMQAPRMGSYTIMAERIGYTSVNSPISVALREQVEVVLNMDVTAVVLSPLEVKARSPYDLGFLAGYYERLERNAGGRFITRDQIDHRGALDVSDLLRDAGRIGVYSDRLRGQYVTMRGGAGECTPRVYLNGTLANRNERAFVDEVVRPSDLEGVEIYHGVASLPPLYHDETGCGVILLWTHRGDGPGQRPFSWKRLAAALGLAGAVVLLIR
jgi:hypothetical protein